MSPTTYSEVLARNIRAARSRADMSQQTLAARMRAVGFNAWLHQTVGNVEKGKRRVTAEEVLGLAFALGTTMQRLMTPLWEDKWVELPSGMAVRVGAVVSLVGGSPVPDEVPNDLSWYKDTPVRAIIPPHEVEQQARYDLARRPIPVEEGVKRPVANAVVTSVRGVLVGQRIDREPPWGFIGGEIEPDESPADAAFREVKEETGLRVQVGGIIGERLHPKSGRQIIYVDARPAHGTEVFVGDPKELDDVQWVSLAEADERMREYGGMFDQVHEYLARELGEA